MDLGLKGKVAMVSGASRGIGRAIALGLAAEGCRAQPVRTRKRSARPGRAGSARKAGAAEVLQEM